MTRLCRRRGSTRSGSRPSMRPCWANRRTVRRSLTLARNEVPVPIALRLYLPEVWTDDAARLAKAGVPQPLRLHRSKSEIALAELDRVLAAGVRFGVVLADAAYGSGTGFRRALSDRDLIWAVGIPRTQKVYASDVVLTWPVASRGRPRQRPVPDIRPVAAQEMLAPQRWRTVTWRRGTKGPLRALFAAVRVRVADGTPPPRRRTLSSTPPRRRGGLARGRAPLHSASSGLRACRGLPSARAQRQRKVLRVQPLEKE